MKEIKQFIRDNFPAWHNRKTRQPRPPKTLRQQTGRKPNARQVDMKPEYITHETAQA